MKKDSLTEEQKNKLLELNIRKLDIKTSNLINATGVMAAGLNTVSAVVLLVKGNNLGLFNIVITTGLSYIYRYALFDISQNAKDLKVLSSLKKDIKEGKNVELSKFRRRSPKYYWTDDLLEYLKAKDKYEYDTGIAIERLKSRQAHPSFIAKMQKYWRKLKGPKNLKVLSDERSVDFKPCIYVVFSISEFSIDDLLYTAEQNYYSSGIYSCLMSDYSKIYGNRILMKKAFISGTIGIDCYEQNNVGYSLAEMMIREGSNLLVSVDKQDLADNNLNILTAAIRLSLETETDIVIVSMRTEEKNNLSLCYSRNLSSLELANNGENAVLNIGNDLAMKHQFLAAKESNKPLKRGLSLFKKKKNF